MRDDLQAPYDLDVGQVQANRVELSPLMQELFEVVARRLEMTDGRQRLELLFENGRLRDWSQHRERQPPGALHGFDR